MAPDVLQQEFVGEVLRCLDVDWDRVEVHYEYFVWQDIPLEQSTSNSFKGEIRSDLDLSFDALEVLRKIWEDKPQGQAEHWTWVDFHLDSTGKYRFDFGYDMPRMAARTIQAQSSRT